VTAVTDGADPLPDWTTGATRLVIEQCATCGRRWYFARTHCPACGAGSPVRREAAGEGTAVAATAIAGPEGDDPVAIVLVDLDEGVRVMGRADPGIGPGDRVRVGFPTSPPLPHFTNIDTRRSAVGQVGLPA
jgi:uncharacterized OB-fold protein